jgi:thiamine biosynthesis lipoprotein
MITAHLDTWKTHLSVSVRATPTPALRREVQSLLNDEVARLDALASRFRADSELSAVNARPGQWVDVSWGFVTVLSACLDAAQRTGGLVDPTLGSALKTAGYDDWAGQESTVTAAPRAGNWTGVGIRPGGWQAQVLIPEGTALDLGSVAKAWLADRLAVTIARSGYEVCANMGGDLRVIATNPWTVWADAELPGIADTGIQLTDAGLATSGLGHRRWNGGHHIIDPRTGRSARTPWHSVSVVAATAAQANTAATASLILGPAGPAWLRRQGLDARLVGTTGQETTGRWIQEEAA